MRGVSIHQGEIMDSQNNSETIILTGELKIEAAARLRDTLLRAYEGSGDLWMDMQQVTAVDVSGLQVLCAAHRAFFEAGRQLAFHRPIPPVVKHFIEEAGFSRELGCLRNRSKTCLWIFGEDQ
jgi:anti-anti-sigma regulatory factor